jgi:hypothetical protein
MDVERNGIERNPILNALRGQRNPSSIVPGSNDTQFPKLGVVGCGENMCRNIALN